MSSAIPFAALQEESDRLGQPPPKTSDDDPRHIVSLTLEHIKTNAHRMNTLANDARGCPSPARS